MFWRNMPSPYSGSKNKPSKELARLFATCFHAGFLLNLFFDPEDGGDMFLKMSVAFNGLQEAVTSQKMELFTEYQISEC
jgi:hypothetical protein